jgi:hypothetical protein
MPLEAPTTERPLQTAVWRPISDVEPPMCHCVTGFSARLEWDVIVIVRTRVPAGAR